jgi:hypothetical protein
MLIQDAGKLLLFIVVIVCLINGFNQGLAM